MSPPQWLASIRVQNLGPHKDTTVDLDESGHTEIEEGSQWGKTWLLDAICLCLWGTDSLGKSFDLDDITKIDIDELGFDLNDPAARAKAQAMKEARTCTVSLTTTRGTVYTRSITGKRKITRSIQAAGQAVLPYNGRESDFAKELKALGWTAGGVHTARIVLVPEAWRDLTRSLKGMPLRDFLFGALVNPDSLRGHVAKLMLPAVLCDSDPLEAKAVGVLRTAANKTADRLKGRAEQAKEALEGLAPAVEPPGAEDAASAAETVEAAKAWAGWDRETQTRAGEERRVRDWRARQADIPDAPDYDPTQRDEAAGGVNVAKLYLKTRKHIRKQLDDSGERGLMTQAGVELKRAHDVYAKAVEAGNKCLTCGKTWGEAKKRTAALKKDVGDCQDVYDRCEANLRRKIEEAREADKAVEDAESKLERKLEALATFDVGRDRQLRLASLGAEPTVTAAPDAPTVDRPLVGAEDEAKAVLASHARGAGAAEQAARQRSQAEQAESSARLKSMRAAADAARIESLLVAVRAAPSVALVDALAPLNVDGLQVRLQPGGGCAVYVDGFAWSKVSDGRKVAADAAFRGALRKAVKLSWWLLAIDRANLWSEGWPTALEGGPVLVLRTSAPDAAGGGES